MKHFKHFLLVVLVALTSSLTASAYDFKVNGIYYNILSQKDMTCEVTLKDYRYDSYSGDIVIPSSVTYNGKTFSVTAIGDYAFYNCSKLTSVEIPKSVTQVGDMAFQGCEGLPVKNNLRYAGTYLVGAVDNTQSTYTIMDGTRWIGSYAFGSCYKLKSVKIPYSVTSIENGAFCNCDSLQSISIPVSVTSIGDYVFSGCGSLPVVKNLRYADTYLIEADDKTQSTYSIKEGTKWIGCSAFYDCSNLRSVEIPESVTSIENYAFHNCSNLDSVSLPYRLTSIGSSAFSRCSRLTSVEIPDFVTSIGSSAFSCCSRLTSVNIPYSVTSIGIYAFSYCSSLISFTGKFASEDNRCLIIDGVLNYFAPKGLTSYVIPNSVTSIGNYAFSSYSDLTSVEIPNSVTSIGEEAFYDCSGLTLVKIGNAVNSIEDRAFEGCSLNDVFVSWNSPAGLNIDEPFSDVYKITLHVPVGTTENYKYRSPWNNFKEIVEYAPGGDGKEACKTPEISIKDKGLSFYSSTPNAKYYYTISCNDNTPLTSSDNGFVNLSATYEVSVYAYAEGYKNSETVKATLVWVNPTLEGSNILSMEAKKAVLIRSNGNSIVVSGTERGERIELYSTGGVLLNSVSASDNETIISCNQPKGEAVIVKYGGKSAKVLFK